MITTVYNFTEKQVAEFKNSFAAFDKLGEGVIASQELGTVMRALGCNITQAELGEMIREIGDGRVDFTKFLVFMAAQMNKQPKTDGEEEVRKALEIFDVEGNGSIPVSTFRHVMMNTGERLTADEIDEVIRLAPLNAEGKINIPNFTSMIVNQK